MLIFSLIVTSALSLWLLTRMMRARPEQFTAKALQESTWVLGLLAVFLIAVVSFFIFLLRN